jgi:hypothetical protein
MIKKRGTEKKNTKYKCHIISFVKDTFWFLNFKNHSNHIISILIFFQFDFNIKIYFYYFLIFN